MSYLFQLFPAKWHSVLEEINKLNQKQTNKMMMKYKSCKIIHIKNAIVDEMKNDHRSKFSNSSNWKEA